MKKKINHLFIAIIISACLLILTIIATTITTKWDVRYIYNLVYFTCLSLSVLLLNAYIFSKKRRFIPERLRKVIRISIILGYSLIYTIFSLVFIFTGQIVKIQILIFLSGMNPFKTTLLVGFLLFVAYLFGILFLKHKISIKDSSKKSRRKIRLILIINIFLFLSTILFNILFLNLENQLIEDKDNLILYESKQNVLTENVSELNKITSRPNVIFILLESISPERVGYNGYERNVSPNIDNLANKSIVFMNAYATSTHSDYAQPGLLSSRYIYTNDVRTSFDQDPPRKFIWDIFKEDNYNTGYISSQDDKWQNVDNYLDVSNVDFYSYSRSDGETDYGSGFAQKDYDHKTGNLAIEWLNKIANEEEPFFLYLNFQATHNPQAYPEEHGYYKPDENDNPLILHQNIDNRYDNALRYVDEQIGKILIFLKENNLSNNTIISITSDHGHDLENKHGVFGHGLSLYDEELKVPALIYIPGAEEVHVEERVSHIDFVPTLIDLLGYNIPKEFQGEVMKKDRPIYSVIQSHKYEIGLIDTNNIKVHIDLNRNLIKVFNLTSDPLELKPLKSKDYHDEISKLLLWRYCQRDYYAKERWNSELNEKCVRHNNFNI